MNWNYRWIQYENEGEELFLHEAYYHEDGSLAGVSSDPTHLIADNESSITDLLKMIENDSKLPVLKMQRPGTETDRPNHHPITNPLDELSRLDEELGLI